MLFLNLTENNLSLFLGKARNSFSSLNFLSTNLRKLIVNTEMFNIFADSQQPQKKKRLFVLLCFYLVFPDSLLEYHLRKVA